MYVFMHILNMTNLMRIMSSKKQFSFIQMPHEPETWYEVEILYHRIIDKSTKTSPFLSQVLKSVSGKALQMLTKVIVNYQ